MRRSLIAVALVLVASTPAIAVPLAPPADLPRYDLAIRLDTNEHVVQVRERVTWTNRHQRPATELVFNVYPQFRLPTKERLVIFKTIELLKQDPSIAFDEKGGAGAIHAVRLEADDSLLATYQQTKPDTAFVVALPRSVGPGESVTVVIEYTLCLPHKQGRWGWWEEITFLNHWHPTLAYYDDSGWQPTPFVPWHQPFFLEAGLYRATIDVPAGQVLACSAALGPGQALADGWMRYESEPVVVRDFALFSSSKYREYIGQADGTSVRVVALPEHEWAAQEIVKVACQAIPVYNRWFGPTPYRQITIAQSHFPWNGNECGALVMLDQRIFVMPHLARAYMEYLVSHEILHQWWYNTVGTDGYRETWMDEGITTYFTHRYINQLYGRNNRLLDYPAGFGWLPNIHRENYRYCGRIGSIRRGDAVPTVAPKMEDFGSVVGLFSGAYDRGSRVVGMIEERLGETAMIDFFRQIYRRYYFRILRVADLRRELEEYTGQSWEEFFKNWVYGNGLTDWKVDQVDSGYAPTGAVREVKVILKQAGQIHEATTLGFQFGGGEHYQIRVPIDPKVDRANLSDPPAMVERLPDNRMQVTIQLTEEPTQITVDPDQILEDENPSNNFWRTRVRYRLTPLYTQLEDSDLMSDYDRWNIIAGPWLFLSASRDPWFQRSSYAGFRIAANRTQEYYGGAYAALRGDYRDLVVGVDGMVDHWPWPRAQLGFVAEQRIGGPYFGGGQGPDNVKRAVLFARHVFQYTGSMYMNPMHYAEVYGTFQDNQLPYARVNAPDSQRPLRFSAGGVHYHLDLLTPYWFPRTGFRIDAAYGAGKVELPTGNAPMQRVELQAAAAHALPEATGWFSQTVMAGQVSFATSTPTSAEFFALGGSTLFRGFDLTQRQGSTLWATNLEWRIPLATHLNSDYCDHVIGLRNVYLAAFYDVGAVYVNGDVVENIAQAVGGGIRLDVAWFSFIERTTLRLDIAKAINSVAPVQYWLGLQYAF